MARNSTNDRNDTVRNLDHATQNRELTDTELDGVSGATTVFLPMRKSAGGSASGVMN